MATSRTTKATVALGSTVVVVADRMADMAADQAARGLGVVNVRSAQSV
jgi:hypothetical protein